MKLRFWGATDDVTGSLTFLHLPSGTIAVDAGLAQGPTETEKLNLLRLPIAAREIDAVIITHAHLDHCGLLPKLVRDGFRGPVFCTPPTARLMRVILLDSAKLNQHDSNLYQEEDVTAALRLVRTCDWDEAFEVLGASVVLRPAGHILGASSVLIRAQGQRIVFSGDLGRYDDPMLPPHGVCPEADVVVMESTYGGHNRKGDLKKELHSFLMTVGREGRVGIIASFAVARGQLLLALIHDFYQRHPEEKVRVVMDSPMMKEANAIYQHFAHLTLHGEDLYRALEDVDSIDFQKEWNSLRKKTGPLVILSSSGMLTGGRVGRHLANWHEDGKSILFLPGHQGAGTPGRSLLEGNRTLTGPDGVPFTWEGEVWTSEAFSSHADQAELLRWAPERGPARVFLLHGEQGSKEALRERLSARPLKEVRIPARGEVVDL